MPNEALNPDTVYRGRGYSHAYKAGNVIYLCGQAPFDKDHNIVGKGDFLAQAMQAFENMKLTLEGAGAAMSDIVKLGFWVTDYDLMSKIGPVYEKYLTPPFPAALGVEISRHPEPDIMIQVHGIAVIE